MTGLAPKVPVRDGARVRLDRGPKRIRPRNAARHAASLAEDFGPLADAVRRLPCCVQGGPVRPVDPAHVVGKARGHAWLMVDGREVGNIAPLCRGHHTGAPGGPRRPQHQVGIPDFERENVLELRLPRLPPRVYPKLADIAAAVGEWVKNGADGADDDEAPC